MPVIKYRIVCGIIHKCSLLFYRQSVSNAFILSCFSFDFCHNTVRRIHAYYVYDVDYEHLREYNTILARIGNNLNQIAKRMNATGNVYEADVKEVKELMKQVWQSQKSMLSKQPSIKQ